MALKHVTQGQPFRPSASAHNAFVDAALAHQREKLSTDTPSDQSSRGVEILIKNETVSDRSRYDVMAIPSPLIGPADSLVQFQTNLCWQGIAPDIDDHVARWAVLQQPLPAGQIGRAIHTGETIALIDINDANDTHVEIATGDYRLQSGTTGSARILWKESGTGADKWAVIRIGDVAAAGGGGDDEAWFRVKTIHNDYLTCRTWDGTTDGDTDVLVARPYSLRHLHTNYPWIDSASLTTVTAQEITVEVAAVEYTLKVAVPYSVDEVIKAKPDHLGVVVVSDVPLTWEDQNRNAHAWSAVDEVA